MTPLETHGERAEHEPMTGVWDGAPSGLRGQSPWWGVRGKALVGKFQDGHFELNVRTRRASQAPNHDRPNPLLPSTNSPDLHQSQERRVAKVGWTCPSQSTPWRRPCWLCPWTSLGTSVPQTRCAHPTSEPWLRHWLAVSVLRFLLIY